MMKTNTELHYVTQIREIYDGHNRLGNDNFADLKDSPYLFPLLPPNIVWSVGKALFLDAISVVIVTRFIFSW